MANPQRGEARFGTYRLGTLPMALLVLLVHGLLLLTYYRPQPKFLVGDETLYFNASLRILSGTPAALDPLWPPFYPHFLAWLFTLGGGSLWVVQAAQTLLLLIAALLLRAVAARFLAPGLGADLAAFLVVVYPPLAAFAHYLWPEVLHLALFLTALWIVVSRHRSLAYMPVLGVVLGLALLTKSLLTPFVPVLLLPLLRDAPWPRCALRVGLVMALLFATVGSTVVANHHRTGYWMIADSSLFNLWVGLNDHSRISLENGVVAPAYQRFRQSGATHRERNAFLTGEIRQHMAEHGFSAVLWAQLGRQYFRLFDKDSYLTAQLPGGALSARRQGYRGPPSILTDVLRWISYLLYGSILAAAAAGLVLLRPSRHPWLWLVLAFLGYNLALFLVLHVKSRYRIQLLPFLFLYAGGTVDYLRAWRAGQDEAPSPGRQALAAVAVLLALFLAFGGRWLEG